MNRILLLLSTVALIYSCKQEPKGYAITAITDMDDGAKVTLKKADENDQPYTVDSTIVANSRFTFSGQQPIPEVYYLFIEGAPGNMPIIVENANLNIIAYRDSLQFSKVTGTKHNDQYAEYVSTVRGVNRKMSDAKKRSYLASREKDSVTQLLATQQFENFQNELIQYRINFVKENPDSFYSAVLLYQFFQTKSEPLSTIKELYQTLPDDIKETHFAKKLAEDLKNAVSTEVGDIAPNFSAKTPSDKLLALNDVKGKVTIIDFWASWCGPCRKENPNVVAMYDRLHDKGLNIIGVSLDRTKSSWEKAIEDDNLQWNHVSNLLFWRDPIAKQYGVTAIPHTIILDKDGRIAAKNLRGEALEMKVRELLEM